MESVADSSSEEQSELTLTPPRSKHQKLASSSEEDDEEKVESNFTPPSPIAVTPAKRPAAAAGDTAAANKKSKMSGKKPNPFKLNADRQIISENEYSKSMVEKMLKAGRDLGLEGKKRWEELKVVELELYLQHLEIRVAQTKLILKQMEADGDH